MKYKLNKNYIQMGIVAFLVIVCSITFFWALNRWSDLKLFLGLINKALNPLIWGLVIAYLLNPIVKFLEKRVFSKLGSKIFSKSERGCGIFARIISIFIALSATLLIIIAILVALLPELYFSIETIVKNMPGYVDILIEWIETLMADNPDVEAAIVSALGSVTGYFTNWLQNTLLTQINSIVSSFSTGVISFIMSIFNTLVGFVMSIYILYNKETLIAQSKKLMYSVLKPRIVNRVLEGGGYLHKTFGGFISGKLLDSLIIGILCLIFMNILKMPYVALVSVIIGITNIIPFFGPFIGAIPSAVLIFMESPLQCLIFIIFIIVLQQFDGNILGPKILGSTTGLTGFWVMFAILFFGKIFGFMGMLLGVPVFAVIYFVIKNLSAKGLKKKNLPVDTAEYKYIDHIDAETNEPVYKGQKPEARGERTEDGE